MNAILASIFGALLTVGLGIFSFVYQRRHERKEKDYEIIFSRLNNIGRLSFLGRLEITYAPDAQTIYDNKIKIMLETFELTNDFFIISPRIHHRVNQSIQECTKELLKLSCRQDTEVFNEINIYINKKLEEIRNVMPEDLKFKNTLTNEELNFCKNIKFYFYNALKNKVSSIHRSIKKIFRNG